MITLGGGFISGIIGYISDLTGDFMPLILLVTGVTLGLWIFEAVLNSIKNKQEK
jgi:hypothetical protein